jgi:taurine dioxygenase
MSATSTGLRVEDLAPALGSIVHDIDLAAGDLAERHGEALRRLLREREVLFFRDQQLPPHAQVRFGEIFGTVQDVSAFFPHHAENAKVEILKSSGRPIGTDVWHADLTWQARPPLAGCLFAVTVPAVGGDTMFASMTTAFASLDAAMRARLEELAGVHNWEGPEVTRHIRSLSDGKLRYQESREAHPPLEHPVVAVHPQTRKKVLNVNALYTTHIVGVPRDESQHLLAYLTSLARVPEWQVRFRWQPGSVAIWDNRAVQHYAVNDYHPEPRLMHRVTIV